MKIKAFLVVCLAVAFLGLMLPKPTSKTSPIALQAIARFAPRTVEAADSMGGAKSQPIRATYARLPMSFEANEGQTDKRVKFLSRGSGYTLFLTPTEAVLALSKPRAEEGTGGLRRLSPFTQRKALASVLRMKLVGANAKPEVAGVEELPGKSNYFIGNDPKQWHTNVPTYSKVKYDSVYPGVDLVYYGNQRELEYDFTVAPGADPRAITLGFEGTDKVTIDAQGDLVLASKESEALLKKPLIYQQVGGIRQEVAGAYTLKGKNRVGFEIAAYDATQPLVIDPVLAYSTYLGGSGGDEGRGIAVDSTGNAYLTGQTTSSNFPTTSWSSQTTLGGGGDAFVTKLSADGSSRIYSTYLGGGADDAGVGIAIDSAGSAYVTGSTGGGFPTTVGASQTVFGGYDDAFVTKLSADGSSRVYSTYLGGSDIDYGFGIAVDSAGNAYVTGLTGAFTTNNFPTTTGASQTTFGGGSFGAYYDAFVTKLSADGSSRVYSTYLGGSEGDFGYGISVDSSGSAYVTGQTNGSFPTTTGASQTTFGGAYDAFVTKLSTDGSSLVYSTYLGGTNADAGRGIAVDSVGNAYVTGYTGFYSGTFPTTTGASQTTYGGGSLDAFVTKLSANGSSRIYSTYLGGSGTDYALGIAVDTLGSAHVIGATSGGFPTTAGAPQTTFGGSVDAFVTKLSADGSSRIYSTYLGGSGDDLGYGIAVDSVGNAYVIGTTTGGFPTTPGASQTTYGGIEDAFAAKINPKGPVDLLDDLISTVQGFDLRQGISNSLDAKLENAEDALMAMHNNDLGTACNDINAFINEVQAQAANGVLSSTQAMQLINQANAVKTALGCP